MAAVCAYADVYFAEQFKHTGRAVRACRRPISVHAGALESVTLHTREQNCTHLLCPCNRIYVYTCNVRLAFLCLCVHV